jgi:hypothetical protein
MTLALLGGALFMSACGKKEEPEVTPIPVAPPTPVAEAEPEPEPPKVEPAVPEDFEEEAFKQVTEATYKEEFEKIEKELEEK